jgi:hypothetical protein
MSYGSAATEPPEGPGDCEACGMNLDECVCGKYEWCAICRSYSCHCDEDYEMYKDRKMFDE